MICHCYLQEEQERGPRKLQASQPHLIPWEHDGATNLGNHFQAHKEHKSHKEYSA